MEADGPAPQDAQACIAAFDEVDLARYCVSDIQTPYAKAIRVLHHHSRSERTE